MDIPSFKDPSSATSNLFVQGVLMLIMQPWNDPLVLGLGINMTESSALSCHATKQWRSSAQPRVLDAAGTLKPECNGEFGPFEGEERRVATGRPFFSHFCTWPTPGLCHHGCRSSCPWKYPSTALSLKNSHSLMRSGIIKSLYLRAIQAQFLMLMKPFLKLGNSSCILLLVHF